MQRGGVMECQGCGALVDINDDVTMLDGRISSCPYCTNTEIQLEYNVGRTDNHNNDEEGEYY